MMHRFFNKALLGAALLIPVAITPLSLRADDHDRVYHDREHNDDHHWNDHENKAFRIWVRDNRRHDRDFNRLNERDQQAYWSWRHEHPDNVLKINIR